MLPHPQGEAVSIHDCFHSCSLAFIDFDPGGLDEHARDWYDTIVGLMDTTGIEKTDRGTFIVKAERMNNDEKRELADAVDQLASWFYRESHGLNTI